MTVATVTIDVFDYNAPPQFVTGDVAFDHRVVDATLGKTHAVETAHLDGDSDLDLVATDHVDGAVEWFRNDDGVFTRLLVEPTSHQTGAAPLHAEVVSSPRP